MAHVDDVRAAVNELNRHTTRLATAATGSIAKVPLGETPKPLCIAGSSPVRERHVHVARIVWRTPEQRSRQA
jgi:hypothetical protein